MSAAQLLSSPNLHRVFKVLSPTAWINRQHISNLFVHGFITTVNRISTEGGEQ